VVISPQPDSVCRTVRPVPHRGHVTHAQVPRSVGLRNARELACGVTWQQDRPPRGRKCRTGGARKGPRTRKPGKVLPSGTKQRQSVH
jgi:hypothetical protein